MSEKILQVRDLHVYYDNIHAVKGVDLEVREGEVVCLIGANGAGKTTILHTISGLLKPTQGSILYKGEEVSKKPAHLIARHHLVQVPEGRRIFSGLTVLNNLELGGFYNMVSDEEDALLLEDVYHLFPVLEQRKNQVAGTLSGGEQQMLAIGRAMMSKPDLLLLDEPSMGLSPLFVEKIFGALAKLKARGTTILLVEQNASLALDMADRGYVLETGRIVKEGAAEALKEDESVKVAYLGA